MAFVVHKDFCIDEKTYHKVWTINDILAARRIMGREAEKSEDAINDGLCEFWIEEVE